MDRKNKRQPQLKTLSPQDAEVLDALLENGFVASEISRTDGQTKAQRDQRDEWVELVAKQLATSATLETLETQSNEKTIERIRRVITWLETIGAFPAEDASAELEARVQAHAGQNQIQNVNQNHKSSTTGISQESKALLLDALLDSDSGMSHDQVIATYGKPAERVSSLLDTLGYLPSDAPPDDLVQRTIARIENATASERAVAGTIGLSDSEPLAATGTDNASANIGNSPADYAVTPGPAIAFRWTDLLVVSSVFLIGFSLMFGLMNSTREDAMRVACASNLGASSMAIDSYAMDHNGYLPRYDVKAGMPWWNVGQPVRDGVVQSNSAHLFLLPRNGYINNPNLLGCPSNPDTPKVASSAFDWPNARAVSYSYQNQYTDKPIRMGMVNDVALLADKNPMFTPSADGYSLLFNKEHDQSKPGHRHNNPGQMVLTIDGRVVWTTKPDQLGDNIYTAQGIKNYTGTESPANMSDSFLVP